MMTMKSRIALAAALAAISVPTLADDARTCSICGDPTFPAIDSPAPALALHSDGGQAAALLRADPTWPDAGVASPAIRLEPRPEDGPQIDPLNPTAPELEYAAVMGAPEARIATR
ncbi:MAG TPA: hypothetical protein VIV57_20085 [Anaeromyxobacter sp.]